MYIIRRCSLKPPLSLCDLFDSSILAGLGVILVYIDDQNSIGISPRGFSIAREVVSAEIEREGILFARRELKRSNSRRERSIRIAIIEVVAVWTLKGSPVDGCATVRRNYSN